MMTMNHTCYLDMHRKGGVLNRPFPSGGAAKKCKASVGRQMTIENFVSYDFFTFVDSINVFDCHLSGVFTNVAGLCLIRLIDGA